jgi:hypothetical protein
LTFFLVTGSSIIVTSPTRAGPFSGDKFFLRFEPVSNGIGKVGWEHPGRFRELSGSRRLTSQQVADLSQQLDVRGRLRRSLWLLHLPTQPVYRFDQQKDGKRNNEELDHGVDEQADVPGNRAGFLRLLDRVEPQLNAPGVQSPAFVDPGLKGKFFHVRAA